MADEQHFHICEIAAAGYRSLRSIRFPLRRLTVFLGANGVGKTNLYRALQLIQAAAAGTLSRDLATEGGMESALWAGKRQSKLPARVALAVGLGDADASTAEYAYEIATGLSYSYEARAGLRIPTAAAFPLEAQVKEETLAFHRRGRATKLLERRGPALFARDIEGERVEISDDLMASETALGSLTDPARFPDVFLIRRKLLDWRFYHDFRTDASSPLRQPCLAVTTPTLSSDGSDLAAVFATLVHIREDTHDLDRAVDEAFPGARLVVPEPGRTASFGMIFPEHPKRLFEASELSDGTLRFLALAGALLAYRLPGFIALNEPEASLHPDLLEPLARLVVKAAERTQIWIVTHSVRFATALAKLGAIVPLTVVKRDGETWIDGLRLDGSFREDED